MVQKRIYESLKICQVIGSEFLQIVKSREPTVRFCNYTYEVSKADDEGKTHEAFRDFQKNCFYAALLLPFQEYEYPEKKKLEKVIVKVITDSLKKSNEVLKFVNTSVFLVNKAIEYANRLQDT